MNHITSPKRSFFVLFSRKMARFTGHPIAFIIAICLILIWIITGPVFDFSDTWQLVMNTVTSIITFLMVFIIQSSQNRDTEAIQLKLDELIRATKGTHNVLLELEELSEKELDKVKARYLKVAKKARQQLREGKNDTDKTEV